VHTTGQGTRRTVIHNPTDRRIGDADKATFDLPVTARRICPCLCIFESRERL